MSFTPVTTGPFREAAIRMVAATEYFKSTGELPRWAQTELDSWDQAGAGNGSLRVRLRSRRGRVSPLVRP